MHGERDLHHLFLLAVGPDDELAGKDVTVEHAALGGFQQDLALECLEPVRVGATVAANRAQQAVVHARAHAPHPGTLIIRPHHGLGTDHQIGVSAFQQGERPRVELGVAQIDLVADDEIAARRENSGLHGQAVVGLSDGDHAHLGEVCFDLLAHLHRAIARAVFAENQFIGEAEGPQLLAQFQHGTAQDSLLVVDRDDDGDMWLGGRLG